MIDKNGKEITNYDIQKEMWERLVDKKEPHIAHSDLTGEIYVIVGKDKYRITEQAKKAVKAVEQEPCEDAISRTYLLKKFEDRFIELQKAHQKEKQLGINWCINTLKDMPPVKPTQRWIPVSERLPEDLEPVNITWVNHEPEPYYHDIKDRNFIATGIYYRGQWYWYSTTCADYLGEYGSNEIDKVDDAVEIIAWMPLPEPMKGSVEE